MGQSGEDIFSPLKFPIPKLLCLYQADKKLAHPETIREEKTYAKKIMGQGVICEMRGGFLDEKAQDWGIKEAHFCLEMQSNFLFIM